MSSSAWTERVGKTETGEDNRCMRDKAVCVSDKDILKDVEKMSVRYLVTLFLNFPKFNKKYHDINDVIEFKFLCTTFECSFLIFHQAFGDKNSTSFKDSFQTCAVTYTNKYA